jgi:hypothetical protein
MKGSRAHLYVIGLQQRAPLFIPIFLEGKNDLLKSEHRKDRVDLAKSPFYSNFSCKVKLATGD